MSRHAHADYSADGGGYRFSKMGIICLSSYILNAMRDYHESPDLSSMLRQSLPDGLSKIRGSRYYLRSDLVLRLHAISVDMTVTLSLSHHNSYP
jgi:hypothetical protein